MGTKSEPTLAADVLAQATAALTYPEISPPPVPDADDRWWADGYLAALGERAGGPFYVDENGGLWTAVVTRLSADAHVREILCTPVTDPKEVP